LSRIHAVLSGINATIVRVQDRTSLLREACRIAVNQGGFVMAWAGLVSPGSHRCVPLLSEGADQGYLAAVGEKLALKSADAGTVGQAIAGRRMIVANDIANDPHVAYAREALASGFRSQIVLPLIEADAVTGILVIFATEPGFFDHGEHRLLQDLADDISFALDYIGKKERLDYMSCTDVLTGLANTQRFHDRLGEAIGAARPDHNVALLLIDLPRFDRINDSLGRHAADRILVEFAARLRSVYVAAGTIARIGAERFAVIAHEMPETPRARLVEPQMTERLLAPFLAEGGELRIPVKIGVALFPEDAVSAEGLFADAEAAVLRARNAAECYTFYSPQMNARIAHRLHQESRLRKAVQEKQFFLHYQPKVDLRSRELRGVEALIRWQDPVLGLVPPAEFIPLLEETGLIVEVGRWVLEQSIADSRRWHAARLRVPRVAINVSEVQLRQPNFTESFLTIIAGRGAGVPGIDIEITETLLAQDMDANVEKLRALRRVGVKVFLDDFGTGYSGLSQIAHLPLDALKIDASFIAGMGGSTEHAVIVSAIINLAKALGVQVVAEGVEREDQAAQLLALGCDMAQGYLFGRAVAAADIARLLDSETPVKAA
jgi:diguanylate cyclase (GGDEF)-like protein